MRGSIQRLLGDLQALVDEVEKSCKSDAALAGLGDAGDRLKKTLSQARAQIEEMQGKLRSGVKATDAYVHSNPWKSIGIAAAVAFIVGVAVAHRDSGED